MSWVRIWIHVVFSTKNREPFLEKTIRPKVFQHIRENAQQKDIFLDEVNGYTDHIHCLISLGKDQCISKVTQLIKGESSHWINRQKLMNRKFLWQDDYWAVGVSESQLQAVRNYIAQQEEHHSKSTFAQEIDMLLKEK